MKIAILTLPLHTNYGGILQCYALQTVLKQMGHDVYVINVVDWSSCPSMSLKHKFLLFVKHVIKYYVFHKESKFYGCKSEAQIVQYYTRPFINKYIHQITVESFNDIKDGQFDAFVVGSDQIWRPSYYENIENAYLAFARSWSNIKRLAYAVSFGTDKWEYSEDQTLKCKALSLLFDAVSVREFSGIELCKKYFNINAVQVLDPTLLLSQNDYLSLIKNRDIHNRGLFCYILDMTDEKKRFVNILSRKLGLSAFYLKKAFSQKHAAFEERIRLPVEMWIASFQCADFILTDSFHGCVFSIIFNKPFLVIANNDRGITRIESLLSSFSLEDRLVSLKISCLDEVALSEIDWNAVNERLSVLKMVSMSFLQSHLSL